MGHWRISKYSGDSPWIEVFQFWFPARDLSASADLRADGNDAGNFPLDGVAVLDGQGSGAAPTGPDAATAETSREHEDDVLAHAGDLGLDLGLGAVANANHGDDCADANDHAQHGEQGAQLVASQSASGNFQGGDNSHHTVN